MAKVIQLKRQQQLLTHPIADVEVGGQQLELAINDATGLPMVINWRTETAWEGSWADLVAGVADILEQSDAH